MLHTLSSAAVGMALNDHRLNVDHNWVVNGSAGRPAAPELDPLGAIDALFDAAACKHVYLDFGSNRGVQLRKVFQPELYPPSLWPERVDDPKDGPTLRATKKQHAEVEAKASMLPVFERIFGQAPRCHVCAVGFEPNPHHSETLDAVESSLRAAGAPILVFRAAASDADSTSVFMLPSLEEKTKDEDWTATMSAPLKGLLKLKGRNYLHLRGEVTVRTLDVAPIIHRVHSRLRTSNPEGGKILAKFDVRQGRWPTERAIHPCTTIHPCKTQALTHTSRLQSLHPSGPHPLPRAAQVEGAELRVLPHLIMQQALCLLDAAYIEWHESFFEPQVLHLSARHRSIPDGVNGAWAARLLANRTRAAVEEAIGEAVAKRTCHLDLLGPEVDDETYRNECARTPAPRRGPSARSRDPTPPTHAPLIATANLRRPAPTPKTPSTGGQLLIVS